MSFTIDGFLVTQREVNVSAEIVTFPNGSEKLQVRAILQSGMSLTATAPIEGHLKEAEIQTTEFAEQILPFGKQGVRAKVSCTGDFWVRRNGDFVNLHCTGMTGEVVARESVSSDRAAALRQLAKDAGTHRVIPPKSESSETEETPF